MYNRKVIIDAIRNLNKSKKQPKYNKDYTNNSSTQKKKDNVITGENGVNAPVYKSIQIGPSKIHGKGVFSQEPIAKGDVIGVSHIRKNFTKNGQQYQAPFPSTQLGGYYNHSESPNIQEVDNKDHILLLAKRNINPGEELTSNYYNHNIDDLETPDKFKKGGSSKRPQIPSKKNSKAYSRSFEATNKFFAQNPLFKKSKSRKNKIFDPNAKYYADGGAKTKDLPKASYGLTGLGKDKALTFTPFDFRTAYGQVGDFNVNPNYSLSYTTPDLFKKMDVSGNPLTFTIGRPYKTDAQSLTNPTRSFMGEYSLPYNDPAMAGPNPQYDAFLQDVSDYTNTPLSQLSTTQVNQYNAAKNLEGAKQIYKKGIPLTANVGYDLYGNAFGDSSTGPFTGSLALNAGYAPEPGFYGSFDTSIMGVFGKRKNNASIKPQTYFNKGLTRQGDMAFIPKLNILNAIIRQRPEYNDAQTQKILDLYAQDIQQGTTTAEEFLGNKSDRADMYNISLLSPEVTYQLKPFKATSGPLSGVFSATAGLKNLYGNKEEGANNSIPLTPKPYGNIRYAVPLDVELPKNKIAHLFDKGVIDRDGNFRIRKKTYNDYAYDQDYDQEYTGDTPEEEIPTENNFEVNPPEVELNFDGQGVGKADCPKGYERPCEKCRCQKIKMPQRYIDKRGTQLFGNEPIRFKNGGLTKFVDGGPQCPEGFTYDEKTKRCIRKNTTCPEGYFYDAQEGRCKSKAYREKSQLYSKGNKIIPTEEQEKYPWWPNDLTVKNLEPRVNLIEPEKRLSIYQPDVDDIKYAWSPVEIDIYPDLNYEVVADSSKPKGFNEDKSIYYVPDENNFEFEKFKQYKKLKEIEKENLANIAKYPNLTTNIESGYNWEDKYLNPEYNSFSDRNKPVTFDEYKNIKKNEYEECTDCTYGHGEKISYDDDDRITEQNLAHVYNKFYEIPDYETRFEREYDYVDLPDESIIPRFDLGSVDTEAPMYVPTDYDMTIPTISTSTGKTKSKKQGARLIDGKGQKYKHTTYRQTKDLDFGKREATRFIPKMVQKATGYDKNFIEGYENEDGEYIPGEIERAEQEGRKINFKGASSLRDLKNQKEYERQWSEYQKQKDEVRQQNETYLQEYGITPEEYTSVYGQFQDGGEQDAMNAMMKARLAYANMFGNPAAQRMINIPDQPYEFDNGDTGTHYMASMDNYAVPQIQDENGQLMLGNYGPESREAIRFDSDEDANYFAENYKRVSPGFIDLKLTQKEIDKYVKGGYIVEDISVPSLTRMDDGGTNPCPPDHYWNGEACVPTGRTFTAIDPNYIAKHPDEATRIQNEGVVGIAREASDIGKLRLEYRDKNPMDKFLDEKKRKYLKKNKGLNKAAGVTMENFPDVVLQNFINEYNYKTNNYAVNKLGKKEGWNPKRRGEWVDELTQGERDAVAESKYGSKLQPSYWARSLAGIQELGNAAIKLLPGEQGDVLKYNIPGLTKKEQKEIAESKFGALETLAIADLPGVGVANLVKNVGLSTGSDYKELPNVLSGEKMANVEDKDVMAFNLLNYAGAEAIPELGVNLVKGAGNLSRGVGKNIAKGYEALATGNSPLPIAWKLENPSPLESILQNKNYNLTDEEAEIINEYIKNPYIIKSSPEKSKMFADIIRKNQVDLSNINQPISRYDNYYVSSYDREPLPTEYGSTFSFPRDRSWSIGIDNNANTRLTEKQRLVIPSRYAKKLNENFHAVNYADSRLTEALARPYEKELIGNVPEGFKVIGNVKEGNIENIIIKPKKIRSLKKEPKWKIPSNSQLKQEFKVEHELKGNTFFESEDQFMEAIKNATVEEITPELDALIGYRSRTASKDALVNMSKGYKSWPKFRNEGTIDAIYEGLSTGKKMDMPIVLEFPNGTRRIFSGNTRMDASFQLGKNPKVLVVKVPIESPIGKYQTGGEYQLGDEVDKLTKEKLEKLGYTFEIVK